MVWHGHFNNRFWQYQAIAACMGSTLGTSYPNMDKKKVWTSTLLSTRPTFPKSLDILEFFKKFWNSIISWLSEGGWGGGASLIGNFSQRGHVNMWSVSKKLCKNYNTMAYNVWRCRRRRGALWMVPTCLPYPCRGGGTQWVLRSSRWHLTQNSLSDLLIIYTSGWCRNYMVGAGQFVKTTGN